MLRTVFFDLDGTLTDSCPGILAGMAHALTVFGRPTRPAEVPTAVIGPPLYDSFRSIYGMSDADAKAAVAAYRDYYGREGIFDNRVYPGILPMLARLSSSGLRLYIATGKPHAYAARIAEHFGLLPYLSGVYGAEFDGTRGDKADLLAYALRKEELDPCEAAMVGDRFYDVRGALGTGLLPLGVLWGYGSEEELSSVGAAYLARTPDALAEHLISRAKSRAFSVGI